MAMKSVKKGLKTKVAKRRQKVVGTSTKLNFDEALKDATDQLKPPGPGTDIVFCTVEKMEVSRGGIADVRTLSITLVSK
jgi:hypothetical protein